MQKPVTTFKTQLAEGIPAELPAPKPYDATVNHAPRRKNILTPAEKKIALCNALRYFEARHHPILLPEFAAELEQYGRIYMYRFRPGYEMYAHPIEDYPAGCTQAAAIMLMIQNNLDPRVAQHPHELITYGGNGAVFQNWAQYRLTMKYLAEMTEEQTLVMYSGHPLGLFPSHREAPPGGSYQWHDDSQPFSTRRLGALQCPRGYPIWTNDRRELYVHWPPGNCSRHYYNRTQCPAKNKPKNLSRANTGNSTLRNFRVRRHERRPAQGRNHCRLHYRLR